MTHTHKIIALAKTQAVWLWLGIFLHGLGLTWLSIRKVQIFDWYSVDFGNMWETVWRVAHGQGFVFTDNGVVISRLVYHADFILALFAPFAWFDRSGWSLLALQAFGISGVAWLVWSIAKHWLKHTGLAWALAAAWLLYAPMLFPVLWHFHAVTLAPVFLLGMAEAQIVKRRAWVFWVWFGLASLTKEHVGIVAGILAVLLAVRWGNVRQAMMAFGAGTILTLLNFLVFIPSARPAGGHFGWTYFYGNLGGSVGEQLSSFLSPRVFWQRLQAIPWITNLMALLWPLGFFPLLNWWWVAGVLVMLPSWLSRVPEAQSVFHQHHVLGIPFFFLGAMQSIEKLLRTRPKWQSRLGWYVFAMAFLSTFVFSPMLWSVRWNPSWLTRDPELMAIQKAVDQVPIKALVGYTLGLPPRFRIFDEASQLPHQSDRVAYYAVYSIPTFPTVELVGSRVWRIFNARVVEYMASSSAVTPLYHGQHAGLYQVKNMADSARISRDIQHIHEQSTIDARR